MIHMPPALLFGGPAAKINNITSQGLEIKSIASETTKVRRQVHELTATKNSKTKSN